MKTSPIQNVQPLAFPWQTRDPFLFCGYHLDFFPNGNEQLGPDMPLTGRNIGQDFVSKDGWNMYHGTTVPGFPVHPHRGFETVTITRQGLVDHSDSEGAAGRYGNGDLQWMTAGKGLQHCEMMPLLQRDEPNLLELFQVWLNLPSQNKMVDPDFKMLWAEDIPVVHEFDAGGKQIEVKVYAGAYKGTIPPSPPTNSWAADPENHLAIWTMKLEPGAIWELPAVSESVNRTVYFYRGDSLQALGETILVNHAMDLDSSQSIELQAGNQIAELFMLQGKPICEPVVQHGPFVMNTEQEIHTAIADYRQTQFGGWPWPKQDHNHGPTQGRFAKYADGRLEDKS